MDCFRIADKRDGITSRCRTVFKADSQPPRAIRGAMLFCVPIRDGENNTTVQMIESAVARNLLDYVHSTQIVAPDLGAASTECAGGVAAFVGAGSPLTTVKGAGPDITGEDLEKAEEFFRRCSVDRAVFELAPWILPETVDRLRIRGYQVADTEDVVVRRPPFSPPIPLHSVIRVESADWPELMFRMHGASNSAMWRVLAGASAVIPGAIRFAVLDATGDWIACAELFYTAGVGLFANDATLESARGRGAQTAAIHERIRTATATEFSLLAAEVTPGSTSERNYLRCGFCVAYTRTHFVRPLN